ncbi:unnamed protein product, partial [Iphiclides podalirius]
MMMMMKPRRSIEVSPIDVPGVQRAEMMLVKPRRSIEECSGQYEECRCANTTCACGLGGRCMPDGSCHAAECATLGLAECRCTSRGTGGVIGELNWCGVCCQLRYGRGGLKCVGAEFAAREALLSGNLPDDWPDATYNGPNVTMRLCSRGTCRVMSVRAWPPAGPCVSRNAVGVCSPRGVCENAEYTPRSNVYPDIMMTLL